MLNWNYFKNNAVLKKDISSCLYTLYIHSKEEERAWTWKKRKKIILIGQNLRKYRCFADSYSAWIMIGIRIHSVDGTWLRFILSRIRDRLWDETGSESGPGSKTEPDPDLIRAFKKSGYETLLRVTSWLFYYIFAKITLRACEVEKKRLFWWHLR